MSRKIFVLCLVAFILTGFAVFSALASQAGYNKQAQTEVLILEGTPEEIGMLYGEHAHDSINRNLELFWREVDAQGFCRDEALLKGLEFADFMIEANPEIVIEIQGMALAAGVGYEELLAFNALEEIVFNDGCTNLLATGSATKEGKVYYHKNRDTSGSPEQVIMERLSGDHHRFIAVTSAGSTGIAMGINEHGVSAGNNALTTWDIGSGYNNLTINRMILEYSGSASEGVNLVLSWSRRSGSNYQVADSSEAAFIETSHSAAQVRWVVDEALATTNHYTLPEMLEYEDRSNFSSTHQRYDRANALIQADLGEIDVNTMIDISMDQHGSYRIDNTSTVSAATFDGAELLMYAQLGRPSYTDVLTIDLGALISDLEKAQAVMAANMAVNLLPSIVTLEGEADLNEARDLVDEAFSLGVGEEEIDNFPRLLEAEREMQILRDTLFENGEQIKEWASLFELGDPGTDNRYLLGYFVTYDDAGRWVDWATIGGQAFDPLKVYQIRHSDLNDQRWIEYDITSRGYQVMKGYAGISDHADDTDNPINLTIWGDGQLLFEAHLAYGNDAIPYELDISGMEKLILQFSADTSGWCQRLGIVEPLLLRPTPAAARSAAQAAVDAIPGEIAPSHRPLVVEARRLVDIALTLGNEAGEINGLNILEAAEGEMGVWREMLGQTIDEAVAAISALPAPEDILLEDRAVVGEARSLVDGALDWGALEEEMENLDLLEAAESKMEALVKDFIDNLGDIDGSGKVYVVDAILVLRHLVGLIDLAALYGDGVFERAAVSGAGEGLDITDAILIMKFTTGRINQFPAAALYNP